MSVEEAARYQARAEAAVAVSIEQDRIDAEFGVQRHDPAYWYAILGKQFGQLGEALVDFKWASKGAEAPSPWHSARQKMYQEATQVAAVAQMLMEAIQLDELVDEVTTTRPKDPRKLAAALNRGSEHIDYGGEG